MPSWLSIEPHDPWWLHLLKVVLIPPAFSLPVLYAWGGLCFLFFRFSRRETPERLRGYLELHQPFYLRWAETGKGVAIDRKLIWKASSKGWKMFWPVQTFLVIGVGGSASAPHALDIAMFLSCAALLFFGGLFLAQAWYGMRCLQLLGLESYGFGSSVDSSPSADSPTA